MKHDVKRRIKSLEKRRAKDKVAAKERAYPNIALIVLIAYHLGELQPGEWIAEAYARALKYKDLTDLNRGIVELLENSSQEIRTRGWDASDRFWERVRSHYNFKSLTKEEDKIRKLAALLPEELQRLIDEVNDETDPYEDEQAERFYKKVCKMAEDELKRSA